MPDGPKIWTSEPPRRSLSLHWIIVGGIILMLSVALTGAYWLLQEKRRAEAANVQPAPAQPPVDDPADGPAKDSSIEKRVNAIEREQKLSMLTALRRSFEEQPPFIRDDLVKYYEVLKKNFSDKEITPWMYLKNRFPETEPVVRHYADRPLPWESGTQRARLEAFSGDALRLIIELSKKLNISPTDLPQNKVNDFLAEHFEKAWHTPRAEAALKAMDDIVKRNAQRKREREEQLEAERAALPALREQKIKEEAERINTLVDKKLREIKNY